MKSTVTKPEQIGPGASFFDPLAFRPVTTARFGSTGRNTLRGPGASNADLSVFRTFRLKERYNLQFKAEAFNVTNTAHFNQPGSNVSNLRLNSDGSIRDLGNFSAITSAQDDERQFRFGLKFSF